MSVVVRCHVCRRADALPKRIVCARHDALWRRSAAMAFLMQRAKQLSGNAPVDIDMTLKRGQ